MRIQQVLMGVLAAAALTGLVPGCGGDEAADWIDDGGSGDPADGGGASDGGLPPDAGEGEGPDAGEMPDAGEGPDGSAGSEPDPAFLPEATGPCPDLTPGTVTFAPEGLPPRDVRVWIGEEAQTLDGPLVFYWHGTGSSPAEALYGLGQDVIDEIVALGGLVAAPTHDPDAGMFPWFLTAGTREDDLRLADEILGCALAQVGVDLRHVHSLGMSAGGLQTSQMSYRRSGYVASVATYSGGLLALPAPARQDPDNPFAALVFHGGPSDVVFISFQEAGERYWGELDAAGQFAALCDHGGGHTIPTDARDDVWAFFQDHPFGTTPSPYAEGLPASFPSYCALEP